MVIEHHDKHPWCTERSWGYLSPCKAVSAILLTQINLNQCYVDNQIVSITCFKCCHSLLWLAETVLIQWWLCCLFYCSHDGQYVISGSEDHFVYIWRTQHGIPSSRRDKNEFYESFSGKTSVSVQCAVTRADVKFYISAKRGMTSTS